MTLDGWGDAFVQTAGALLAIEEENRNPKIFIERLGASVIVQDRMYACTYKRKYKRPYDVAGACMHGAHDRSVL